MYINKKKSSIFVLAKTKYLCEPPLATHRLVKIKYNIGVEKRSKEHSRPVFLFI